MASPPAFASSKLDAVNEMLSILGEDPVNSLDGGHADVAMATQLLDRVDRATQAQGWHWNTDLGLEVAVDSNGKFPTQPDWISFDTTVGRYDKDLTIRGQFLWDRKNLTFDLGLDKVVGDLVRYLAWDDMPEVARHYIAIKSGRMLADRAQGSRERHAFTQEDVETAWETLIVEDAENADRNYLASQHVQATINRRRAIGL